MSFFPAAQLAVAVAQPEPIQPLDDDVIEVFSAAFQILDWQSYGQLYEIPLVAAPP